MEYIVSIFIVILVSSVIGFFWVRGINFMHKNYPNYKGEDFLNWDGKNPDWDKVSHSAGRDGWDDNQIHSEGDF